MTKQEFLDQKITKTSDAQVLQLVLGMSKTQLLTALRHCKMMKKAMYTTDMRKQSFDDTINSLSRAYEFAEKGHDNDHKLEN